MHIAIASGKGGTGKTMVATSLSLSMAALMPEKPPLFLDCDVEEPNAHFFLHPVYSEQKEVHLLIPSVDEEKCNGCGKCADICQYHAIAVLGQKTLVFPQLCHGCGSCTALCPQKAITEVPHRIGLIERGQAISGISFARGVLDVGEPMSVPIIRQLKIWAQPTQDQTAILDAPPGTSCPVVETLRDSHYVLLVTEPTPFGLHDLRLASQVACELGIPAGVIINREETDYPDLKAFCHSVSLPIHMQIPFKRTIAEGIAQGKNLVEIHPEFLVAFQKMYEYITGQYS